MKKIIACICAIGLVLGLTACGGSSSKGSEKVKINVNCQENLMFNKYDVEIDVDGDNLGKIDNGNSDSYSTKLSPGEHEITFTSSENSEVDGSKHFTVKKGTNEFRYDIKCERKQINVSEVKKMKAAVLPADLDSDTKYKEVEQEFTDAGFTNVETKALNDLSSDDISEKSVVSSISIDGDKDYDGDDRFFSDAKVKINYHSPKKVEVPEDLEGSNYKEAVNRLKNAGFENVRTEKTAGENKGKVESIKIGDDENVTSGEYAVDEKITVVYYSGELDETDAQVKTGEALEQYGKRHFPYYFNVHYITDCRAFEKVRKNVYYMKAGLTVKDSEGNKYDTVVEGKVKLMGDKYQVLSYHVTEV